MTKLYQAIQRVLIIRAVKHVDVTLRLSIILLQSSKGHGNASKMLIPLSFFLHFDYFIKNPRGL